MTVQRQDIERAADEFGVHLAMLPAVATFESPGGGLVTAYAPGIAAGRNQASAPAAVAAFAELKRRYMVTPEGGASPSASGGLSIITHTNSEVRPIIGGPAYFRTLRDEISRADTQFIYLAGWWLDPSFSLDGVAGPLLTEVLKAEARAGVDVRVLGWVLAPAILRTAPALQGIPEVGAGVAGTLDLNGITMTFINTLRAEPTLANKACLNILAHPAGAVHLKMAIVGGAHRAIGFTGGLDFRPDRHSSMWHDVQAQVTGPAVQGFYEAFRQMWNEIKSRPPQVGLMAGGVTCDSHSAAMPDLPARAIHGTSTRKMQVQSVRTLPQFHFPGSLSGGNLLPSNAPLSYASNGLFEISRVWEKGVSDAQIYVYIEDQAFISHDVFRWINTAVKKAPDLRVVLVWGRPDPNDPPNSIWSRLLNLAVNDHLLNGLSAGQIDRIGLFRHREKVIHTKSTIVDDHWALIGSANVMRRSLYTDFEHAIDYMDEDDRGVAEYRVELWGTHLQARIPVARDALAKWFGMPFLGAGGSSGPKLDRLRLPFPRPTVTDNEQVLYEEVLDPDSRKAWGRELRDLYLRNHPGVLSP